MATQVVSPAASEARESWVPMIAIALGQVIMSFNVASLPVSISGMVQSFGVPPTTVGTAIVMYSLAVAGFVMLGAKLTQRFGATRVFRAVVALFGIAQVLMTFSPVATVMLAAQGLAGLSAAVIVPALVALIANHYRGQQQATAVGALGSARAAAGVAAFLIGGLLGTFIGWRPVFGILIVVSAIVFVLSFRLKPDEGRPEVGIDIVGVVLAAVAIILISFGFNNLNRWGLGVAQPSAPFNIFGLSPAPVMIVIGVALLQAFIAWTRRQQEAGRTPLLDLRVITSGQERAAVFAMFAVVALEAMLNFSVPLYIQIIQGRTPIETAIAMLPFNLTVFFTAMLVVRHPDAATDRPDRVRHLHGGSAVARVGGAQRLERADRHDWTHRLRPRPGSARHAGFQRAGHRGAEGDRRRCGRAARHHPEPRRRGRHGGGRRAPGGPVEQYDPLPAGR
jgi:MFS family permease